MKRMLPAFSAAVGLFILILDSQTALMGAAEGIELCLKSVIPSLLPFFALSIVLTDNIMGNPLPFLRPVGRLCGIPSGAEFLLGVGFLGGYPVGAQCVAQAYRAGSVDQHQAERLLMFCSNAGPAFLFGMAATGFSRPMMPWLLWGSIILGAVYVSVVFPATKQVPIQPDTREKLGLQQAMPAALRAMAGVCGWIILFKVVTAYLSRWFLWLLPVPGQVLVSGLLEIANGCLRLREIPNEGLRLLVGGFLLAFGGICVTMQTAGVIGELKLFFYLKGKLIQTYFVILFLGIVQYFLPAEIRWIPVPFGWAFCLMGLLIPLLYGKLKNKSRFPAVIGV